MAASRTSCRIDSSLNAIADIKAALQAKGLITLVLYEASDYLIFSTPLTSKVIKIYINSGLSRLFVSYGDEWTSGSTITNGTYFEKTDVSVTYIISGIDVMADTSYFAILWQTGTYAGYALAYVGALDNEDELAFGFTTHNATASYGSCVAINITDGTTLMPITFGSSTGFKDGSGNLVTIPLMWAQSTGELEMNGTNPAGTVGVKVCSCTSVPGNAIAGGAGYIVTPSNFKRAGNIALSSSLLLEYTP